MRKFNNTPNKCYNVDGKIVWESRSVAVVASILAICENEIYVLIGQRGSGAPDAIGKWNMVCGYLDYDEDGADAIRREVYEESGLDLDNYDAICSDVINPWSVKTSPTENRQNVVLRYGCVLSVDKLPALTSEHAEQNEVNDLRWIRLNEVGEYDFAFNHDSILMQYVQHCNNKHYLLYNVSK